ncbi:hypothetical protein AB205_0118620 [Aquarana catesbeiana]|uniref:Uncharacterized protein n=1 Tax=Aquarana catesbeiana TaxID=8400 RepID=A0A2G9QL36_AQUCT|nr:hypothetical protein AB205_0118620 [Aquarana catesbeiana]
MKSVLLFLFANAEKYCTLQNSRELITSGAAHLLHYSQLSLKTTEPLPLEMGIMRIEGVL